MKTSNLKVTKCFFYLESDYFYNIKPLWVGNFGTVMKNSK